MYVYVYICVYLCTYKVGVHEHARVHGAYSDIVYKSPGLKFAYVHDECVYIHKTGMGASYLPLLKL